MKTRLDVLKFISGHLIQGRGIKIQLDDKELRLHKTDIDHVWRNAHDNRIIAIINIEMFEVQMADEWAKKPIEFYDLY